jgi:CheY-like chemotaxis protein
MSRNHSPAQVAELSHDLRSPLNGILGWVRLLREGALRGASRERALESIERNALEQAQLLEELSLTIFADAATNRRKSKPLPKGWNFDPSEALRGIRVLVVDDHIDSRRYYRAALRQRGARVRSLPSTEKVIATIENWHPHVLLGNLRMPGEDGFGLMRRLRELPEDRGGTTPAAMITGMGTPETRRRALAAGYHAFMIKPVEPTDLVLAVARLAVLAGVE